MCKPETGTRCNCCEPLTSTRGTAACGNARAAIAAKAAKRMAINVFFIVSSVTTMCSALRDGLLRCRRRVLHVQLRHAVLLQQRVDRTAFVAQDRVQLVAQGFIAVTHG